MLKSSAFVATAFLLMAAIEGCSKRSETVYVNLAEVVQPTTQPRRDFSIGKAPVAMREVSSIIAEAPEKTLENSSSPEVTKLQADVEAGESEALKKIAKRIAKIYQKQIDIYAAEVERSLNDPDSKRINEVLPKLYATFSRYAEARLPLIARLSFLSGVPDSNPKNAPPPADMRPVPHARWVEANGLRSHVNQLDADYSRDADRILGEAQSLALQDRLAILKKVEDYRREMMDRALLETTDPLRSRIRPATLRLESAPAIVMPQEGSQKMTVGSTETLPEPPQVEFERPGESEKISKEMVRRQLEIWAAINGYTVTQSPLRRVRDLTKDFERWRNQQRVGP